MPKVVSGSVPIAGEYWALIIGIDKYQHAPPLDSAVKDATAVREVLEARYGFSRRHVIELLDQQATGPNIQDALYRLTQEAGPEDSVFIYYAGHGQYDKEGRLGWWVPVEGKPQSPGTFVTNAAIRDYIDGMKAKHVYLVADSCFSGTLFGKSRAMPPLNDKFFANLYANKSRWGLTSGGTEPVADSGKGGHSIFAYHLIKLLKENSEPYLVPSHIYEQIAPIIANNTDQTPRSEPLRGTGDEGGQFVFRLASGVVAKQPSAAPAGSSGSAELGAERQRLQAERDAFEREKREADERAKLQAERKQVEEERRRLSEQRVAEAERKKIEEARVRPHDSPSTNTLEEQVKKAQEDLKKQQDEIAKRKQAMIDRIKQAEQQVAEAERKKIEEARLRPYDGPSYTGKDFVEGDYWALIIGINKYPNMNRDKQLETARRDAEAVARLLMVRYGFTKERMIEMYDEQASRKGIIRAFSSLKRRLTDKDSLFIYYAGHGEYESGGNGMGWWIPSDAELKDPSSYIFNSQVRDYLASMPARHIFMVADSAFGSSLMEQSPGLSKTVITDLYQAPSRWALTPGGLYPVPDVADQSKNGHSVFAWQFMKILSQNTQPYLLAKDIADAISVSAPNQGQGQVLRSGPVVNAGDHGGQFVFRSSTGQATR